MKPEKLFKKLNFVLMFLFGVSFGFVLAKIVFFSDPQLQSNSILIVPNYIEDKKLVNDNNVISNNVTKLINDKNVITENRKISKKKNVSSASRVKENRKNDDILCRVPLTDPWDPEIAASIDHPQGIDCYQVQPYLTLIDYEGYLGYNESEVKKYANLNISFRCSYWTFDRKPGPNDTEILYGPEIDLRDPVKLDKDTVEVICKYDNGTKFYHNVHAHPVERFDRIFAQPSHDQLSVIFLLVDSVSFSALKRNLPLTYNYTKNVMGMKYFNAYNKIGTNSFPNQMPMLTGKRMYFEQEDMKPELPEGFNYYTNYFDNWPLIWKHFQANNYATGYNSEWPTLSLFNYYAIGFSKKPTDFYYQYFWSIVDKAKSADSSSYCFNNKPLPKINTDLIKRHVVTMQDKLQFLFTCVSETTHKSSYFEVERQDEYLLDLWQDLYEEEYLNRTVVIFASDHGIRMGEFRATYTGSLEDKLPFYGMWFPSWFYKLHPDIEKNIDFNREILTTPFDIYETLKDIANGNFYGEQRPYNKRGLSQLYALPSNRTCNMAGVADHWCACNKEFPAPTVNNTIATEAATFFVSHLNSIIQNFNVCRTIEFKKFNYFRLVEFNNPASQSGAREHANFGGVDVEPNYEKLTYFVGITTEPNEATVEAYLDVRINKFGENEWSLRGGLTRISEYNRYSYCVQEWWPRHFCSCK